jgi:uncharacterized protein (UPF0333 family)
VINLHKKAQVAIEYVMVFGFLLLVLLPLIGFYYTYANSSSKEITARQIDQIVRKIGDGVETVYYLGYPSQTTIRVYIPQHVTNLSIQGNYIIYSIDSGSGESSSSYGLPVNMTGSLPYTEGNHIITIKSLGNMVEVSHG